MRARYLFGEAFTNLRRNVLVSVAAVLAVFTSLLLVFGALVFQRVVQENIGRWRDDVRVIAFLSDDLTVEETTVLQEEIQNWDEVDEVIYFTKADAYEEALELFADDEAFLELVREDPSALPASFRIKPTDARDYAAIRNRLELTTGVRQAVSMDQAIDRLINLTDGFSAFFIVVAVVLGLSAAVLIANTIRLAIYARREEISIMRLVGASNWFIRIPYLMEGMIQGLVGGLLAVGFGVGLYLWLAPQVDRAPDYLTLEVPFDFLLQRAVLIALFGLVTGLVGSAFALWRFLRD